MIFNLTRLRKLFTIYFPPHVAIDEGYRQAKRLENFLKTSRPSNFSHSATVTSFSTTVANDVGNGSNLALKGLSWASLESPRPLDVQHGLDHLLHAICSSTCKAR